MGLRVTFQSSSERGALSKDLCHPKASVCSSAKVPAGLSHWKFLRVSLSSSNQISELLFSSKHSKEQWGRNGQLVLLNARRRRLTWVCLWDFGFLESSFAMQWFNRVEKNNLPVLCQVLLHLMNWIWEGNNVLFRFGLFCKTLQFLPAPVSASVLIYFLTSKNEQTKGTLMPKYWIPVCFSLCLLLCLLFCLELGSDLGENF